MTFRILAAALCCLSLAACDTLAERLSQRHRDAEWGQTGGIIKLTERAR